MTTLGNTLGSCLRRKVCEIHHIVQVVNMSVCTTKRLFTSRFNIKETIAEAKRAGKQVLCSPGCMPFLELSSISQEDI